MPLSAHSTPCIVLSAGVGPVKLPGLHRLAPPETRIRAQGYVSRLDDITGTFSHAAPELLLGVRRVNEKADCFSYGVVLWEIATQERPLRGQLRDLRCAARHVHALLALHAYLTVSQMVAH